MTPAVFRRRADSGVAAIIFALTLVPMMLACGLMIDGYNLYSTDQALQRTVDAAALAAAADNTDMTTAHAQSLAFNYLDHSPNLANITITGRTATSDTTARTVTVTLDAEFPTYFMKIVQVNTMKVSITSRAERAQPGPIDLVLALDTTQSMNSPPQGGVEAKITTLRSAATALVNQVMATGSPQIQVGIVPYSAYMNVGPISPVPDWVNAISRTMTSCKSYPPGCPLVYYDCLVDGVFTTNGCGKRNCECAVWQKETYDWKGCIGPRSMDGSSTGTEAFLASISSPTFPKYPGVASNYTNCAASGSVLLPLTTNLNSVLNKINTLKISGETYIPSGLTWGWNVLAPGEPYDARTQAALQAIGGRKVLVLMTDGINSMSPRLELGTVWANGLNVVTPAWRDGTKTKALIGTLCSNIKDDGIEIFTVLFDERDAEMTQIMKDCASEPSKAFTAADRAGLLQAFSEIGDQLKKLKLVN